MRKSLALTIIFAVVVLAVTACGRQEDESDLAPLAEMPAMVHDAPHEVQIAYRYAVAHGDDMTHIPCYCGCAGLGHTSIDTCFVAGRDETGAVLYDEHALTCNICVKIVLDSREMIRDGVAPGDIAAAIDAEYSRYGPPTPLLVAAP